MRNYGRGPSGWRIRVPIAASWGPRISTIIVASERGVQLCKTTAETINGEKFVDFVRSQLVPILNPYNGRNPNSIVIMGKFVGMVNFAHSIRGSLTVVFSFLVDNHPIHRLAEVRRLITATGALLRFLPPYSPDLNPVETIIGNAKAKIREQEVLFSRSKRPQGLVLLAVLYVAQEVCQASVTHCGY